MFGLWNFGVWDFKSGLLGLRFDVWNIGFGILQFENSRFGFYIGIYSLVFGVGNFGVWAFEFGVLDKGYLVSEIGTLNFRV